MASETSSLCMPECNSIRVTSSRSRSEILSVDFGQPCQSNRRLPGIFWILLKYTNHSVVVATLVGILSAFLPCNLILLVACASMLSIVPRKATTSSASLSSSLSLEWPTFTKTIVTKSSFTKMTTMRSIREFWKWCFCWLLVCSWDSTDAFVPSTKPQRTQHHPNSINILRRGKQRTCIVPTNTISHHRLYTTKLYSSTATTTNNDKSLNYACREWLSKTNTFESLLDEVCDIRNPSGLVILSDGEDDVDENVLDWDTDTRRIALQSVIQSLWRVSPDLLDQVLSPDGKNKTTSQNNDARTQQQRRILREDLVRISCSRVDFLEQSISEYEKTIGMDAIVGTVIDRLVRGSKAVRDPEYQRAWLEKQRQRSRTLVGTAVLVTATIAGIGLSRLSPSFHWPQPLPPPQLTIPSLPTISWKMIPSPTEWGVFTTTKRFWDAVSTSCSSMGLIVANGGRWLWSTCGNVGHGFAGFFTSGMTTTGTFLAPAIQRMIKVMMSISSMVYRILEIPIDAMTWVGARIGLAISWVWRWVGNIASGGVRFPIPKLGSGHPPPDLQNQQHWMKLNPKYQPPSLRNIAQ